MNKQLIEALKKNEKPFGLMTGEMQAKARYIGMGEFERFTTLYKWNRCGDAHNFSRVEECTYRLRPDYEQEPEVVECEVDTSTELFTYAHPSKPDAQFTFSYALCSYAHPSKPDAQFTFSYALCCPGFIGFKYEDDPHGYPDCRRYKDPRTGQIYCFWAKGREVLTPTHVLFKRSK